MSILANVAWLTGDKAMRLLGTILLGMVMARKFGPTDFGVFSYATAYIAIFASFASLGLQAIVVRELVSNGPLDRAFSTAFVLQFVAGLVSSASCVLVAVALTGWSNGEKELFWGICVLALSIPLKASDVVRYWYEAATNAKKLVRTEFWVWLTFLLGKMASILLGLGLKAIFIASLLEVLATYVAFYLLFKRDIAKRAHLKPDARVALHLLRESWPLMVSGASIMLYMRLDQVMVGHFLGQASVGIYSAATRIGEAWYFLPIAFITSAFPSLVRSRSIDSESYLLNLRVVATAITLLSYCVALVATMFAEPIVALLYGSAYQGSAAVLSVYVWGGVFVSLSTLGGRWLVVEGLTYIAAIRSVIGAVVNCLLNLALIPDFGVLGAAAATLVSFAVANVLSFGMTAKSRSLFWILLRSLVLMDIRLVLDFAVKRVSRLRYGT